MGKRITHILLFLVGMLAATAVLHQLDKLPFWGKLQGKLSYLGANPDRYDTLFLGSSRVRYGFIPSIYDARMAELGAPTTTLNLGLSGLRQHDYDTVLDWLIENKPPKLRRLMIEVHQWEQGLRGSNWMTSHEIEVHSIKYLPARLQSIAMSRHPWSKKLEKATHALLHSLTNYLRVGQGPRIADSVIKQALGRPPWHVRKIRNAGWTELTAETVSPGHLKKHKAWLGTPEAARAKLAAKRKSLETPATIGGFNVAALKSQIARLRACGIEPIYVIMPHCAFNFFGRDGVRQVRDDVTVFEFDVVSENEDLHELAQWFDASHMVRSGGELFSNKLADRIHALDKN
jgi:hypothetical protein